MIAEPAPNTITRPYRGLSVQDVDVPLTPAGIEGLLRGREIYRRTAYLVLRNGPDTALVAVRPADPGPLFSPVAELRVLSGPDTTVWITDPAADVGNATALASAALKHRRDGALAYVVQGRFEHVNFIWRPAPLAGPGHRGDPAAPAQAAGHGRAGGQLRRGPAPGRPGRWTPWTWLTWSRRTRPRTTCCPAGAAASQPGSDVSFLDCHPPYRPDWLLIGCERSRQFHDHFYRTQTTTGRSLPPGPGRRAG